jgi:hypothetical protein
MIRRTGLAPTSIRMEQNMREIGRMTYKTESVPRPGLMGQNIMDNIVSVGSKATECTTGMTDRNMLDNGKRIVFKDSGSTRGLMAG